MFVILFINVNIVILNLFYTPEPTPFKILVTLSKPGVLDVKSNILFWPTKIILKYQCNQRLSVLERSIYEKVHCNSGHHAFIRLRFNKY